MHFELTHIQWRSHPFAIFLIGENSVPDFIIAPFCLPGSATAASSFQGWA